MINNISYKHFNSLESTNQKLYQLANEGAPSWTVVTTDDQTAGKGYANNIWQSEPYKNATFSFLVRHPLKVQKELPYFNMWVATEISHYLSDWQLEAKVKWPNDVILNNKKIAGILIENKLMGMQTKFCIIGIGLNLNQESFDDLEHVSSLYLENGNKPIDVRNFITGLMVHFYTSFDKIRNNDFQKIHSDYNQCLFKRGKVSVFEWKQQKINGIIKRVNLDGNLIIELENGIEKVFRHKEIKLFY